MSVINTFLPYIYGVIGIVIIWLIVELAITTHSARKSLRDIKKSVDKVVDDVDQISNEVVPVIKQCEPLLDRVSLTVDAANLEIMRLDEIMSDVSVMTSKGAKAATSLDSVASAPLELVNNVAEKVRRRFGPKKASKDSLKIGEAKLHSDNEDAIKNLVDSIDEATSKE